MKKLLIALCAILLTGCATRQFDPVEYNFAISTAVLSTRALHQCGEKGPRFREYIKELNTQTMYLYEYEKHHDENKNVLIGVTNLRELVLDFVQVENVTSEAYCVHKLSTVQSTSRALAKILSGMNLELCSSDALERLSFYKDSYDSKRINKSEYEELVRDLQRLVRSDLAYCTEEQNELLKKTVTAISSVISAFK